ncbi:glycoside hydrolase family 15 protein [Pontibacter cellulosilyticus]|uniref:Glycoside hydrolase family 15 protein n=1 Tax=Pontibacter cellulosilyticus TaxID=1720253 RepID=A0A923N4E6_9BACT|nr:glycoside hydrolase family 15 protein [Pontibacter cellulosilyticus]MBC5991261.1 glycoside hydrolase family 15 protein [Pontibacter cellulosilyticus]
MKRTYQPIENYGLIGNLHTVALVSKAGSLDYLPFTRFDSPTIFAALLDKDKGGYWSIAPADKGTHHKQLYLPDTGVLLTRFFTDNGMAELTDFMPVKKKEQNCAVVRILKIIKGHMEFEMDCQPRFDYARADHEATKEKDDIFFKSKGSDGYQFRFLSNQEVKLRKGDVHGTWTLKQGESAVFAIEAVPQDESMFKRKDLEHYSEEAFAATVAFWRDWIEQSTYKGRWREIVHRSAITLKMMTSLEHGSTIAAATFSLPETIGGDRNWDYRYTWIRDAAFTMYAFLRLGFTEESKAFLAWLMDRCKDMTTASDLQLMYAVDGETKLDEAELKHLEGYMNSDPVRIGNAAYKQFQLDIYGELIDTIYLYNKHGGPITYEFWKNICLFVDYVIKNWKKKDHGIWEVRHEQKDFLYSKMMCWVALDRAILIARNRSFPAPLAEWQQVRDEIYKEIFENYWSEERQSFVQYKGSNVLDASVLLMTLVRILSPVEPRWKATLRAIEEHLVSDSLVYRYLQKDGAADGFDSEEGTFSLCSFWYIESLAKSGEVEQARLHFEKMLGYANHLGLFSEQIGLKGEQLGNFPQAFTHLALISAAYQLNRDLSGDREHRY